jgi:hypothetical protein
LIRQENDYKHHLSEMNNYYLVSPLMPPRNVSPRRLR